jgi:hypothetical protein
MTLLEKIEKEKKEDRVASFVELFRSVAPEHAMHFAGYLDGVQEERARWERKLKEQEEKQEVKDAANF